MLKKKYKTYLVLSTFVVLLFLALVINFNYANNLGEIYTKPMFLFKRILGV